MMAVTVILFFFLSFFLLTVEALDPDLFETMRLEGWTRIKALLHQFL